MRKSVIIVVKTMMFTLSMVTCCSAFSSNSDELINGVVKYQAGRIENIVLDSFMRDLSNEKFFKKFFPKTSKSIQEFDGISGKRLIPLLRYYFDNDLESLGKLSSCIKTNIAPIRQVFKDQSLKHGRQLKEAFAFLDSLLSLKKDDSATIVTFIENHNCITPVKSPPPANTDSTPKTNSELDRHERYFISVAAESVVAKDKSEAKIAEATKPQSSGTTAASKIKVFSDIYNTLVENNENISSANIDKYIKDIVEKKATWDRLFVSPNSDPAKGIDIAGLITAIDNLEEINGKKDRHKHAIYIHQLAMAMEALGFQVEDRSGFQKFKSTSLFLANLTEASKNGNDGSAVEGVLKDFVNEDVVYNNKRDSIALYTRRIGKPNLRCNWLIFCNHTWFLGSYYGVSAGALDENSDGNKHQVYRAFGPVGIEFKIFSGPILSKPTSVTIMYAPVDIGIYVTDELKGEKYDVSVNDITSPSYFLSFSSKNSPMSLQLGYQKDIPIANNKKENMVFLAFSFDLPLFTIW